MLQALPVLAYAGAAAAILLVATGRRIPARVRTPLLAGIALLFAAFSILTVAQEGLVRFWVNHTTTLAGNQVWFDLLLAVTIGFVLIAPRARAVGMPLLPWAVAVIATACIALLPMLARLLWLEERTRTTPQP
jgi:hypothetical protein